MGKRRLYAVLTGDVIGSSRWETGERQDLLADLKKALVRIEDTLVLPPLVFRGDSFQGVISQPEEALRAALIVRADLRSHDGGTRRRLDARIAIGVGTIEYLPEDRVGEGFGDAYRYSGMELDALKKKRMHLVIRTPWPDANDELKAGCALLDVIIRHWTREQAEAIGYSLQGLTQGEVADRLHIIQPSVNQRLRLGGYPAVQEFLERYRTIIREKGKGVDGRVGGEP